MMNTKKQEAHAWLDRIANGYRASQIMFTAARLGLFAALNRAPMTADELADAVAANRRATRILCDALAAIGLLEKRQDRYCPSVRAGEFLLPDAPQSQHALFLHGAALYERWGQLYDVVLTGEPTVRESIDQRLVGDEGSFARAMASTGSLQARQTAAAVNLAGARTMLDIGGGPGIYAIAFARRWPKLNVTLFDNAKTLEVAQANIDRAGLAKRVRTLAGDAFRNDLAGPYDFILVSNLIHSYSSEDNQRLMVRGAQALVPGGHLCVKDFVLQPGRTAPLKASLFAVNMLVNTTGGDCYTLAEIRLWLREAGLRSAGQVRLAPPTRLVLGRRKKPNVSH